MKRLNKAKATDIVTKVAKTLTGEDSPSQCEIDKAVASMNNYTGTAKSGKAILEEMRTATIAIDPIESLFHGINFRQQGDRLDAIQRTRIYCAGAEKRATDRIIEDRQERIEDLRRQMKMANAQIERLERAIHQISSNRASEVVRACQEPYGCVEAVGLAPKDKWTAKFTEGC